MLDNFTALLGEVCQLDQDRPIVVGLSGGPDSQCLFDLLSRVDFKIIAAHFDHQLRLESAADAQAVQKFSGAYKVPFQLGSGDVRQYASEKGMSLEEAARELRYTFLFSVARKVGAQAVAVGHHADDQVESVLMHLIRGSGMAGLRGMQVRQLPNQWSSDIALIRPLLGFWRQEILDYCADHHLTPLEDHTNQELIYWRNRIRLELIPLLETYNPKVKEVIWRMSSLLSTEFEWIDEQVQGAWEVCVKYTGEGSIAFSIQALHLQPLPVRRRLVIRAVESIRQNARNIGFALVDRVIRALQSPPSTRQMDIGLGIRIMWEDDLVWLAAWEADLPFNDWPHSAGAIDEPVFLQIPGSFDLGNGWRFSTEEMPVQLALQSLAENVNPFEAWIALPEYPVSLNIRTRKEGDRIQPFGMDGHSQKLADFMINVKIPSRYRSGWPLVCIGDEIVWVPGYTINHAYRISETTKRALSLKLSRS